MASSQTGSASARGSSRGRSRARTGKVRLRRFAALMIPSTAVTGLLVVLTAQGALAAQFAISGIPFEVTATQLKGTGFEQYGSIDNTAPGSPNLTAEGGQQLVMVSVIGDATLVNMCQSIDLGGIYLHLSAGTGSTAVHATDLVADSDQLSGNASFGNINIGQDASTMTEVPGQVGPLGDFGQQADTVTINNLRQENYATTAAQFTLPGLSMDFESSGC
ncbi:MAG TPA: DUF6230 family protein [Actinocrinis sp.]|jgi:hypothetical protein